MVRRRALILIPWFLLLFLGVGVSGGGLRQCRAIQDQSKQIQDQSKEIRELRTDVTLLNSQISA